MLVLSRRIGETIIIGDTIEVKVVGLDGGRIKLGVTADPNISVYRKEVYDSMKQDSTVCSLAKEVREKV